MKPPQNKTNNDMLKNNYVADDEQKSLSSNTITSIGVTTTTGRMKQSLSLTSLPPSNRYQEPDSVNVAENFLERQYNSLKKSLGTNERWRCSWDSGKSHSSCSLPDNNFQTVSTGSGKDEFWAAIRSNYDYIMDTNLLDSCQEARGELECNTTPEPISLEYLESKVPTPRTQRSLGDPRSLLHWLKDMEKRIERLVKSLNKSTPKHEVMYRLSIHKELHSEIISHQRLVRACIRAGEKSIGKRPQIDDSIPLEDTTDKIIDENNLSANGTSEILNDQYLRGLEHRYHLLYLRAIEVQFILEKQLKDKKASNNPSDAGDENSEPAVKLKRLSNSSVVYCTISDSQQSTSRPGSRGSKSHKHKPTVNTSIECRHGSDNERNRCCSTVNETNQTVDFDADSEGSDCETPFIRHDMQEQLHHTDNTNNIKQITNNTMEIKVENHADINGNSDDVVDSSNIDVKPQLKKSSCVGKTSTSSKRKKINDDAKFNKSNRKSKNCATFYFKHLDTDPENQILSSQVSDANKSEEISSDEEDNWYFTNCKENNDTVANSDDDIIDVCNLNETCVPVNNISNLSKSDTFNQSSEPVGRNDEIVSTINENNEKQLDKLQVADQQDDAIIKEQSVNAIKQLVHGAEILVREDVLLKTQRHMRHSISEMVYTPKTKKAILSPSWNPKIERVQEWLQRQSSAIPPPLTVSVSNITDCEASGEYTDSDSVAHDTDTSEGLTDSNATCLQNCNTSHCTSSEVIGGSADLLSMNQSPKIIMRNKRRNSDRPWSVACLSQLQQNTKGNHTDNQINNSTGLANHSISESALNHLSSPKIFGNRQSTSTTTIRGSGSKNSLKKRRPRYRKKTLNKRSESGSDGYDLNSSSAKGLNKTKSLNTSITSNGNNQSKSDDGKLDYHEDTIESKAITEDEKEANLMQPSFQLGPYNPVYSTKKLGALAELSQYNQVEQKEKDLSFTGTEDTNFSEQAWDSYQEKYNSEAYSEGVDSEAARRLLEFGDDYRNYIDSQSDCCSSLSAANNMDSMSPQMKHKIMKTPQDINGRSSSSHQSSPMNHNVTIIRRRRTVDFDSERRRQDSEDSRHSLPLGDRRITHSISKLQNNSSKSVDNVVIRKLEFDQLNGDTVNTSIANNSISRRRSSSHRNSSSFNEKSSYQSLSSLASGSEAEDDTEIEVKNFLRQSYDQLDKTIALRSRHHLLHHQDYREIIAACRENIKGLERLLYGPPGTMLTQERNAEINELLSSWNSLLSWSENALIAHEKRMEIKSLKATLTAMGNDEFLLDSEESIHAAIKSFELQKAQLMVHRSTILRLNASVHSWLTGQEHKLSLLTEENKMPTIDTIQVNRTTITKIYQGDEMIEENVVKTDETRDIIANNQHDKGAQFDISYIDDELHKQMKDEISDLYKLWDDADQRIKFRLEHLTASLIAWNQFEFSLRQFQDALGKDKGTLKTLQGALDYNHREDGNVPMELALNVKEVAKRLSECMDLANQQNVTTNGENFQLNSLIPFNLKSSSNGSLSDSGISDGGGFSDGGLSERERRLGALRRLAKQLENDLAPGSKALKSISMRMEAAESELKSLQDTCRELIVRTAQQQHNYHSPNHQNHIIEEIIEDVDEDSESMIVEQPEPLVIPAREENVNNNNNGNKGNLKRSPLGKKNSNIKKSMARSNGNRNTVELRENDGIEIIGSEPDPDDPKDFGTQLAVDDKEKSGVGVWRRVIKIAVPIQLALISFICAVCFLEPHCCEAINNFSMSMTPHLRYVRGPPPI